jgi:small subunit ribosomal protein S4
MSRYRGPRLRITRRLGELPGLVRKSSGKQNPPGQHGATPKKPSQYSIRLQEKQKLRFHYGVNERQLVNLVKKARRTQGSTGERLLQLLEMRLDTVIFRSGFAPTLRAARQLVLHGHVCVNNQRVNIPSFQCKPGDNFQVKKIQCVDESLQLGGTTGTPTALHIQIEPKNYSGQIKQVISRTDVSCPVNEFLIIEYYSRKV